MSIARMPSQLGLPGIDLPWHLSEMSTQFIFDDAMLSLDAVEDDEEADEECGEDDPSAHDGPEDRIVAEAGSVTVGEDRPALPIVAAPLAPAENDGGPLPPYDENGGLSETAPVARSFYQHIDGLLSGVKWIEGVGYSFPDSTSDYQAGYPAGDLTGFSQLNADQRTAVHAALSTAVYTQNRGYIGFSVEGLTNLAIDFGGNGFSGSTMRCANNTTAGTAYAYYPSEANTGGDAWFGPSGVNPVARTMTTTPSSTRLAMPWG